MELCSMLCGSQDERGVWGRMVACICVAESLCYSLETITALLSSCTPIQNKKFFFIKIQKNLLLKWIKLLNKILTREDLQMASRHVQRCSTSLVMREMPVQIIWDFITPPPGWLKLSKTENTKCLWGCAANYWWECMVSAATLENFLTVSTKTGHTIYLSNKCIMQAQAEDHPT